MPAHLRPITLLILCVPIGCEPGPTDPPAEPAKSQPAIGVRFDPASVGVIRGQVLWSGTAPKLPPIHAAIPQKDGTFNWAAMPNPFAPQIHKKTNGLAGAVVYLKGIDPEQSRPWDLPPVRVQMTGHRIVVHQGDGPGGRAGFVRRGDEVEMVSTDKAQHLLRARGASNFTLPFPDPHSPLKRTFGTPGHVELSSAAGLYWAAAELFVDDHPYYAITDREGRYTLHDVPAGVYELVCRVRNWHIVEIDHDPQTGLISRHRYGDAIERVVPVSLQSKETKEVPLRFETTDFPAPDSLD